MKGLGIKLLSSNLVEVEIVCDCGRSHFTNELTGKCDPFHRIDLNSDVETTLRCNCGRLHLIAAEDQRVSVSASGQVMAGVACLTS